MAREQGDFDLVITSRVGVRFILLILKDVYAARTCGAGWCGRRRIRTGRCCGCPSSESIEEGFVAADSICGPVWKGMGDRGAGRRVEKRLFTVETTGLEFLVCDTMREAPESGLTSPCFEIHHHMNLLYICLAGCWNSTIGPRTRIG